MDRGDRLPSGNGYGECVRRQIFDYVDNLTVDNYNGMARNPPRLSAEQPAQRVIYPLGIVESPLVQYVTCQDPANPNHQWSIPNTGFSAAAELTSVNIVSSYQSSHTMSSARASIAQLPPSLTTPAASAWRQTSVSSTYPVRGPPTFSNVEPCLNTGFQPAYPTLPRFQPNIEQQSSVVTEVQQQRFSSSQVPLFQLPVLASPTSPTHIFANQFPSSPVAILPTATPGQWLLQPIQATYPIVCGCCENENASWGGPIPLMANQDLSAEPPQLRVEMPGTFPECSFRIMSPEAFGSQPRRKENRKQKARRARAVARAKASYAEVVRNEPVGVNEDEDGGDTLIPGSANRVQLDQTGRKFCRLCKSNRELPAIYLNHVLEDENGVISCPVLRALECPLCGASGDNAHTVRYCPRYYQTRNFWLSPQSNHGEGSSENVGQEGENRRRVEGMDGGALSFQTTRNAAGGYTVSKF